MELCPLISAANLRIYPYGFYIYKGDCPKPVDQRWQGLIQAHNFYFTDLNKVVVLPQTCMKNIHTSLANILQVICYLLDEFSLYFAGGKSFASYLTEMWTNGMCINFNGKVSIIYN